MKETAYLFQAALLSLWWVGLTLSSNFFEAFQFDGIPPVSFWSFFAADMTFLVALSVLRAYFKNVLIEFIILGAFGYATAYCWNASYLTGSGYLSSGVMTLGFSYNIFLCFSSRLFRTSSTGLFLNATKTLAQIVCIWCVALLLIPFVLIDSFGQDFSVELGLLSWVGGAVFVFAGSLGLVSAFFMVWDGGGTPLPLDQTNTLVVTGPYRFVRNPMAIAGISQGLAIALIFQSLSVLIYSLLGGLIWHFVVRPIEEADMEKRFGESYLEYREAVSCWIPKR
ncbi:isoprenylcysteine carboxylmethyltransferase family protein [Mariniblastus sp.]|nr:isoprenylcysteine carboxylmethyltransferase family protein [Mariniblastus sp.]